MRSFFLLIFTVLFTVSCHRPQAGREQEDQERFENPAGEAVLRHMLSLCPHREEAKLLTIVLGELQSPSTDEFAERFADTGLKVTPSRRLVAGAVNGEVRIFDRETQQPPIILQVSELTPEKDQPGNYQATGAWAFKDKAMRQSLRLVAKPEGGWEIRKIADIPIIPRNQDWKQDLEKK